jgi:DNA-binding transcriptional MerR regulator
MTTGAASRMRSSRLEAEGTAPAPDKGPDAFRTISEVAAELAVPQHVLRFWESRFPQIRPLKRAGGRRFYRPPDIDLLRRIRTLLYDEGYTIKGVQRLIKDKGGKAFDGRSGPDSPLVAEEPLSEETDAGHALDAPEAMEPPEAASTDSMRRALGVLQLAAAHAKASSTGFPALRSLLADIDECRRILEAVRR